MVISPIYWFFGNELSAPAKIPHAQGTLTIFG